MHQKNKIQFFFGGDRAVPNFLYICATISLVSRFSCSSLPILPTFQYYETVLQTAAAKVESTPDLELGASFPKAS